MKKFLIKILVSSSVLFLLPLSGLCDEAKEEIEGPLKRPASVNVYNPNIHHRRPSKKLTKIFSFTVHSNFYSQYIWRGLSSSDGWVWQPSIALEGYGVGFSVWGNFVLDNEPNQGQFNEIDFTLYYHRMIKKLSFHIWMLMDVYPNGNPQSLDFGKTSLEANLHLAYPVGPIDLFTHVAVRIISARGSIWWDMGLGYERKLPLNFGLQTSALFAVGDGRFNKAHIADVGLQPNQFLYTLAFPWSPVKGLHIAPTMNVSVILADALRQALDDPTIVYGGLAIYYNL